MGKKSDSSSSSSSYSSNDGKKKKRGQDKKKPALGQEMNDNFTKSKNADGKVGLDKETKTKDKNVITIQEKDLKANVGTVGALKPTQHAEPINKIIQIKTIPHTDIPSIITPHSAKESMLLAKPAYHLAVPSSNNIRIEQHISKSKKTSSREVKTIEPHKTYQ